MSEIQNELSHSGVLGQKWGVRHGPPYPIERRSDGRPKKVVSRKESAAGKIAKKVTKKAVKSAANAIKERVHKKQPIRVSNLTDEQLRARIARIKLENEYKSLVNPPKKAKSDSGKRVLENLLQTAGNTAIQQVGNYIKWHHDMQLEMLRQQGKQDKNDKPEKGGGKPKGDDEPKPEMTKAQAVADALIDRLTDPFTDEWDY